MIPPDWECVSQLSCSRYYLFMTTIHWEPQLSFLQLHFFCLCWKLKPHYLVIDSSYQRFNHRRFDWRHLEAECTYLFRLLSGRLMGREETLSRGEKLPNPADLGRVTMSFSLLGKLDRGIYLGRCTGDWTMFQREHVLQCHFNLSNKLENRVESFAFWSQASFSPFQPSDVSQLSI